MKETEERTIETIMITCLQCGEELAVVFTHGPGIGTREEAFKVMKRVVLNSHICSSSTFRAKRPQTRKYPS